MNINIITLIGQMISFALLVWFTMKFVWPPLMRAMEERQKLIASPDFVAQRLDYVPRLASRRLYAQRLACVLRWLAGAR